ncbi:Uncharacterised protein g11036 [Pycnogonum litorale]
MRYRYFLYEFLFNCSEPLKVGDRDGRSCKRDYPYVYYNGKYDSCLWFWYTGCDGNKNRFISIQECENFCRHPRGKYHIAETLKLTCPHLTTVFTINISGIFLSGKLGLD